MRPTLDELKEQIAIMEKYVLMKALSRDWHGTSDAANDLRELEAQLRMLEPDPDR
jgi:hypothetical protein